MDSADRIDVEVAYATPAKQVILKLAVVPGTRLEQAIRLSGIQQQFPEIDLKLNKVGIFGRLGKLTDVLQAGDRVEIYRPLIADPKEVRKKRAAEGKAMKKGAGSE